MEYGHIVISNTKGNGFPSLIRFFTKSKYSHSLITIPPCVGKEMCLEAADSGVSALPFESGYRNNSKVAYLVYRFKVDENIKNDAIGKSLENLQKGYGYLELAWFAWRALNKLIGRDIKGQDNWSQAGIICSELVAQYISDAGHPELFESFGDGSIHAQDILDICNNSPQLFELIETKE